MVDAESVALASTAATTMVTLLTTDAWGMAKQEIAGLWRRFRPEHAAAVESDLEAAREEAIAATQRQDEVVAPALTTEWASRLRRLLAANPLAAAELTRISSMLADALADALERANANPASHQVAAINQQARASHHSTVIQIAGDGRLD